jgi:adenylate cyclase
MAETRKLAAILAADVVGFSRLTGSDEEGTLARLRALWSDLIAPTIAVHHGRVVKRTGDGSIIEFRSVVDAVRCGIEVQNGMIKRNAGLPPDRRIEFRVGIHLGDVVEESDGDLMGDGVNIAARLEGIAKPGAICLSEDAYRQVKSRLDLAVSDLGSTQLKNIAEPIRVYLLELGRPAQVKQPAASTPPRLSIVPFRRTFFIRQGDKFVGKHACCEVVPAETVGSGCKDQRIQQRASVTDLTRIVDRLVGVGERRRGITKKP